MAGNNSNSIRLALPKGRMQTNVLRLLGDAGIDIKLSDRTYRPEVSIDGFTAKVLKPQNIVEMLQKGSRDIGFAGADWVAELGANVVELLDTKLDPVRLVAAAPRDLLVDGKLPRRQLLVASEYQRLTSDWIRSRSIEADVVRSFGATEVFPPEDADFITDIAASGATLAANGLQIFDELTRSSTRLYAGTAALADAGRRREIESFVMLLQSVLAARSRVMVEANVPANKLGALCDILPCMREPTVSELQGGDAFAVKAAVPRKRLPTLIPEIKRCGGSDIVVTELSQIVP